MTDKKKTQSEQVYAEQKPDLLWKKRQQLQNSRPRFCRECRHYRVNRLYCNCGYRTELNFVACKQALWKNVGAVRF